jgi:hypothetical protein
LRKWSVRHRHGPGGGRCSIEVEVEEERAHGVDSVAVREADEEAISEVPVVDPMTVQAWRLSRSGRVDGREMIVARVRV